MHTREQRMMELQCELDMLREALAFVSPTDRNRVFARVSSCVAEYVQLVDEHTAAVLLMEEGAPT
jgi:hypothetical protein